MRSLPKAFFLDGLWIFAALFIALAIAFPRTASRGGNFLNSDLFAGLRHAKPPCTGLDQLLNTSDVEWIPTGDIATLSLKTCSLRRFTHQDALQCLRNDTLLFVGDSLTRYQYLSLAFFLEHGYWPPAFSGQSNQHSIMNEHDWGSWTAFFEGTNRVFNGRERCDCCRDMNKCFPTENRYYHGNANVIFLQHWTLKQGMTGHWSTCAPGYCNGPAEWANRIDGALKDYIPIFKPKHLVVNAGLWQGGTNHWKDAVWDIIMQNGYDAVNATNGSVYWKTTTTTKENKTLEMTDAKALHHVRTFNKWKVYDAWALTHALPGITPNPYWDSIHFIGFVYQELNNFLFNVLCPEA